MFIITHDDHIVRHNSLFLAVVILVVCHWYIIINRKNDIISAAHNGKLPDKFNKSIPCFSRQCLNVHIDPVQIKLDCLSDQLGNQILAGGGSVQNTCNINLIGIGNIFYKSPHFNSILMTVIHIGLGCNGLNISIIVSDKEPGWRNGGEPFGTCNFFKNLIVGFFVGYLMPGKIDGIIFAQAAVNRFCKVGACGKG